MPCYLKHRRKKSKYLNQLLEIDDRNPSVYYELGRIYVALDQYDNAISAMRKTPGDI